MGWDYLSSFHSIPLASVLYLSVSKQYMYMYIQAVLNVPTIHTYACMVVFFIDIHLSPQMALDPPIKQGQTRYYFVIFLLPTEEECEVTLTLSE